MRQRLLVPEVIQTSGMDCGVASAKALLGGFGLDVNYGRLREACQTDVDGTSINVIEQLVRSLGLNVKQVVVPVDHVLALPRPSLPAIAVVRLPNGFTHFVVPWRTHGRMLQVMDPARGRRWPTTSQFLSDLYVHRARVTRAQWVTWAATPDFLDPLRGRMRAIGARSIDAVIERALQDATGAAMAHLDATVRMVASLRRARAVSSSRDCRRLIDAILAEPPQPATGETGSVPPRHWFALPEADAGTMIVSGAVLVRVDPTAAAPAAASSAMFGDPSLLRETMAPSRAPLWQLARLDLSRGLALAAIIGVLVLGLMSETVLFRGLLGMGDVLTIGEQRLALVAGIVALIALLGVLDVASVWAALRIGNRLEARSRAMILRKIPRVPSQFLKSRLISDMAERCHTVVRLRLFPSTISQVFRTTVELFATAIALVWLDPLGWPAIATAVGLSVAMPFAVQKVLAERDLRVRNLNGAMIRYYLDSLRGLYAIRTHGAERALSREHEALLVEWRRASLALQRAMLWLDGVQGLIGFILAVVLVSGFLDRWAQASGAILLLYWALNIPQLGNELALLARQYPTQRNVMLRLTEILSAPEERHDEPGAASPATGTKAHGVAIGCRNVKVHAGGHVILRNVDLDIAPGTHVGIVGPSGAGKSTLVGLLLGWHHPAEGTVTIDGVPLTREALAALRRDTAWIDPSVQLWNESLIANLRYGSDRLEQPIDRIVADCDLRPVLTALPDGFRSNVGDGGGLLSGGEGQRVRCGRAMHRADARLVILDEAFRGLAHDQRRNLLDRVRRHWRQATLLCVSHDIAHTRDFDRILVVEGGVVVEQGAPLDLANNPSSSYRQLLDADEETRKTIWGDPAWTRLTMRDGRASLETA